VIRDGQEIWIHRLEMLTAEEREEIAERQRSPEARRGFAARLRRARRIEDRPLNAQLRLLREKMSRGEPGQLSYAELEATLVGSPTHVRAHMHWLRKLVTAARKVDYA
jgi:hypothetical protein